MVKKYLSFTNTLLFLVGALLILGDWSSEREVIVWVGSAYSIILTALIFYHNNWKIALPSHTYLFAVFILILAINILQSGNKSATIYYLSLNIAGLFFWISFFNLKNDASVKFLKLLVILGVVRVVTFSYAYFSNLSMNGFYSTALPGFSESHPIGDYWALVIVVLFYFWQAAKSRRKIIFLLMSVGFYILTFSLSRSAYLTLLAGIIFYSQFGEVNMGKKKVLFGTFAIIALILIIIAGINKTSFITRDYYVQAILGFFHNPLGVGVGNFYDISKDVSNHVFGFTDIKRSAHSLYFEYLTGLGVFSLVFFLWLFYVAKKLYLAKKDLMASALATLFLMLLVNFALDFTYLIPSLFWLWFMILGLVQKRLSTNKAP